MDSNSATIEATHFLQPTSAFRLGLGLSNSHDVGAKGVVDRPAVPTVARAFSEIVVEQATSGKVHVTADVRDRSTGRLRTVQEQG